MITVRDVASSDEAAWHRMFVAYGVFYETAFDDAVLDGVWTWLMDADHDVSAVIAVDAEVPVGFANYRRLWDTFTAGPGWSLDDLWVDPIARGAGAATALIAEVTARAAAGGGGTVRWITAADNVRARRVYDRIATRATWVTYEKDSAPGP